MAFNPRREHPFHNSPVLTVAIPVLIAFIAVMAIGAWMGWTMATTPPPKPIEEIEAETKSEPEEKTNAHAEK